MSPVNVPAIGAYIREQREQAKISLRQLAQAAGVSNPYLSQIERGLRRPSADILQQIARGLRISAEALYVQAGFLDESPPGPGVRDAVLADPELTERQKQMLLEVYESFRKESASNGRSRTVLIGELETDAALASAEPADAGDGPAEPEMAEPEMAEPEMAEDETAEDGAAEPEEAELSAVAAAEAGLVAAEPEDAGPAARPAEGTLAEAGPVDHQGQAGPQAPDRGAPDQ